MIVCRECGTHNDDNDLFCGGCPAFLEHSGERIDEGEPEIEVVEDDEPEGIVSRIKQAIVGDSLPPPTGAPSDVSETVDTPAKDLTDDERRAASLVATPVEEEKAASKVASKSDSPATPQQPAAQQARRPQATQQRSKAAKKPPTKKILPGDLICGRCGEGNPDTRKFCRRCGESLIEAEVAKAPWYRRLIPSRKKKVLKASERPERGRNDQIGTKARLLRGKVLGRLADARRLVALLAIVGIGVGFAIPSARSAMMDGGGDALGRVRRIVSPTYSNIPIDPARVSASSEDAGAPATAVTDSNTLTFWRGIEGAGEASVTVVFVEPTDVAHVLVHPGQQEDGGKVIRPNPRPRSLLIRVLDESGLVTEVPVTLVDEDGFQTVELGVDAAVSAETVVVDCFPDPVITICPITELEFQSKD